MFLRWAGSDRFALTETADRASAQVLLSPAEAVEELQCRGMADPERILRNLTLQGGVLKLPDETPTPK